MLFGAIPSPAQEFSFRHFTVRDGLPSNHITCLFQDSRGFVWVGTYDGLGLFDGSSIRLYGMAEGLDVPSILDIAEDRTREGSLWIATLNGVFRFDGRRFRRLSPREAHPDFDVSAVMTDHRGRLWCFANDTLYHDQGDSILVARPLLVRGGVGQMVECGDSLVWMAHAKGTSVLNTNTGEFRTIFASRVFNHGVRRMVRTVDGSLWTYELGDDEVHGSLARYVGLQCVERWAVSGIGRVDFLLARGNRDLLPGGFNGVFRVVLGERSLTLGSFLSSGRGLQENSLRAGIIDREGYLWVGGNSRGVSRLTRWDVVRIPMDSIESGHRRSVAAIDLLDHLWIAAPGGLWEVHRNVDGLVRRAFHPMSPRPISLSVDTRGVLWVATLRGDIVAYDLQHHSVASTTLRMKRRLVMGRDIPSGFPVTFLISRSHELVYSLGDRGVFVLPLGATRRPGRLYDAPKGQPNNYVQELMEDLSGKIWCGTFLDGLRIIDTRVDSGGTAVSDPGSEKLPELPIRSLLEDRRGRIWIGMRSTGVVHLSRDSLRLWTIASGLPSNTVWSLTEDSSGGIWAGTSAGAARIDDGAAPPVVREPALTGANVFDCGTFHNGLLWFLSSEGLVILDPREAMNPTPPVRVYITDISINGNPAPPTAGQEFPPEMNTITASYVTPSFLDESGNSYRYRLLPREEVWHGPTTQGHVTYALLPPGSYTLEVESANAHGVPSPAAARFSFTITQPFWSRWWFIAGVGLSLVALAAWAVRSRELRLIRKRIEAFERQQELDRERLRISQDMHDEIGSTLTEITMLSELARQFDSSPAAQDGYLNGIAEKSRAVVSSIGEIIWAINPRFGHAEDLFAYIRQYATRFCETAGVRCRVEVPEGGESIMLSTEQRRNVFLVVKESLRNIVRHAAATEVAVTVSLQGSGLTVSIADNGRGFADLRRGEFGTGLESMRKRMGDVGGGFRLDSRPGSGTTVTISLKVGIAKPQKLP
jgi:signal transduction histidine kinase/ligand-binding sensor domain-containing protein